MAPISYNTSARVHLMTSMRHICTIRAHTRRNHQCDRPRTHVNPTPVNIILPIEFIQRHVANLRLGDGRITQTAILLPQGLQTPIKLVYLAVVTDRLILVLLVNHMLRLQSSRAICVQGHGRQQLENLRQPQSQMNSFENRVITVAQRAREHFLQTLPQKVYTLPFLTIVANFVNCSFQHVTQTLRTLRCLRRIFRHIFHDGPKIQTRTPINISQIRKQQVRLVTITVRIISREPRIPTAGLLAFFQTHLTQAATTETPVRKSVATHGTLPRALRTRVHSNLRRLLSVIDVASTAFYQSRDKTANWLQVQWPIVAGLSEHFIKYFSQARALRLHRLRFTCTALTTNNLHVMSAYVVVPHITKLAFIVPARIPFIHKRPKIFPKFFLFVALLFEWTSNFFFFLL